MQNVQERPPFLSKSFLGFLAFNVITYSLLIAELVITNTQIHTEEDKVRQLFSFLPPSLLLFKYFFLCFMSMQSDLNHLMNFM